MSISGEKFALPSRYKQTTSVWVEYAELVKKYQPVDLGQGFPNFPPAKHVQNALVEVASSGENRIFQYTRAAGHPRLVNALSGLYSTLVGREIDPLGEILVTLGAYHALYVTINGLVEQGDEVIIIEPFFECYAHNVETAGGIARFSPLEFKSNGTRADDWVLNYKQLEALFNEKTKLIIVNTPHNPLGKVFTHEELSFIAHLCQKWDVVCVSDEVYEWLVYDSKTHTRMASLPNMWDRTVTIGSAGKTFGATGWKLGWVYGPRNLLTNLQQLLIASVRVSNTFLQEVVAVCVERGHFGQSDFETKRNYLSDSLAKAGFKPILPSGGYFLLAQFNQNLDLSGEEDEFLDYRFTKWLAKSVGVLGIPVTPFFSQKNKVLGEKFVRFCFVKTDECLEKGAEILQLYFKNN